MKFHIDGTTPENGEIFVFGSNLAGYHGRGAALVAAQRFGATLNTAIGREGQSYAIPTKTFKLRPRSLDRIQYTIGKFLRYARERGHEQFFVTRVGCGLAGYKDSQIAPMFGGAPDNCSFAEEWREFLTSSEDDWPTF